MLPFQRSKKLSRGCTACAMISDKKLGNYATVGVEPWAGQNDLTGLFYLLWFEPLSKHLDAVST